MNVTNKPEEAKRDLKSIKAFEIEVALRGRPFVSASNSYQRLSLFYIYESIFMKMPSNIRVFFLKEKGPFT